ncbi:SUN domain-containing protein 2 isoform X2 [Brachyhypopomus gauderio]|uniref:SUN domain-containing protein 2 isoform X2 n=1 Tax=Brachyhypopomus gauderio TaxID=698409 RepID=UPI004042F52E
MSRRSSRLLTSRYYTQEDDAASTCSNGSAGPIYYKESPVRVFKKKITRKLVGSSRTSSRTSSLSESHDLMEEELTGVASPVQAGVWRRSPVIQAPPPLSPQTSQSTEPTGFSSGYSSAEDGDYRSHPLNTCTSPIRTSEFKFQDALDSTAHALAMLFWWLGTAWYSLTSGISLLDVFLLSRHTAGVRKAILLLFLFLLLVFGIWYWYPQRFHTSTKSTTDQTHLHTPVQTPLDDHVFSARLFAMRDEIYAGIREQETKWSESRARDMESLLSEIQAMKQDRQRQKLTYEMLQTDIQDLRDRVKNVDSEHSGLIKKEIDGVQRQILHLRSDLSNLQAASEVLSYKIDTQEAQSTALKKELSDWLLQHLSKSFGSDQGVMMRPDLQRELEALENKIIDRLKQEKDNEKRDVWRMVGETLHEEGMGAITIKEVERIVHRALSLSRADGTGMADYALESAGASVISTRCSETYRTRSACLSLFGIPLWYHSETPRTVTQPEVYPGKCWAFRGSEGFLVISLSYPVRITHVSLEHIPRVLSPTGHIDSAPKDFAVYGMTYENEEGKLLGTFTYDQDGEPIQTYQLLESPSEVYRLVELRVLSNWGNLEYTCIYRFRVHGLNEETESD